MNTVILMGRLTKDPESRKAGELDIASFFLAVDRPKKNGQAETDFIKCSVFGNTAATACKYLKKGSKILLEGSIRSNMYTDKQDAKKMSFEVAGLRFEFCESKGAQQPAQDDGFYPIPSDESDDDLPF